MASLGTYLVLEIDNEIIADTIDVRLRALADALEDTTKEDGLNASFIQGIVKIGIAGSFLLASSLTNWNRLYNLINAGSQAVVKLYFDGVEILSGFGIVRKLSKKGGNSDDLVTGNYGIRFYVTSIGEGFNIITEGGFTIITEGGETIITDG